MSSSGSSHLTEILNGHVGDESADEGLLSQARAVGTTALDPFCRRVRVRDDLLLVPGQGPRDKMCGEEQELGGA